MRKRTLYDEVMAADDETLRRIAAWHLRVAESIGVVPKRVTNAQKQKLWRDKRRGRPARARTDFGLDALCRQGGHLLTASTVRTNKQGAHYCRLCLNERVRLWAKANRKRQKQ